MFAGLCYIVVKERGMQVCYAGVSCDMCVLCAVYCSVYFLLCDACRVLRAACYAVMRAVLSGCMPTLLCAL